MTYGPLKRKPTYYMQVPFQMLKVAPLLRTSFLHSSSGPTINSKTLLQKPDIAPLTYPNLLHLCASPFPYSNYTFLHFSPSNVITLSRLKKSDFFFLTRPCYYLKPCPSEWEPSWFNDLHCHWPGRYKTEPWQQMADSHTLAFSNSTTTRSRLVYELHKQQFHEA